MSLYGSLLSDAVEDMGRRFESSRSLFDQNFGLGVLHDLVLSQLMTVPLYSGYIRSWRHQASRNSGVSNMKNDKEGFKVNLDVQQFKPEEISVKMVDNFVVVEGKHEEREDDHGYISRQFKRHYRIPEDVDPDTVISKFSSDGILSIEAPKKAQLPPATERVIQITRTHAPALVSQLKKNEDDAVKAEQ